ncbi:hypothetical protein [Brevundimonas sp.]|uniref:hypothetical protein n=1 Tax=Brevundimonas sp. TaxID=1871086 RepID=UPI002487184C|nr:hypothetical protein [Brevundimonas sp.]MDI1282723.1 hypothetical protein [Brevundimonas sp.]
MSLTALGHKRQDQLDRVIEAGLPEQGRVFALSLEPIRNSLGPRWAGKRDQVWDAAERALARRLPPPDVYLRIDETTFLTAIVSVDSYEAQVLCSEVLRDLLTFFLGRSADEDVVLTRVASLDGPNLVCERIDPFAPRPVQSSAPAVGGRAPAPRDPSAWKPPLAGRRHTAQVATRAGTLIDIELEVVPVWRLDQGTISAFRIVRDLRQAELNDNQSELEMIDRATLDFLLPLLEDYRREGGVFALVVPLSFSTLSAARPRIAVLDRCAPVADLMRQVVILEIDGLDAGVPSGRLSETVAMVRPFFRSLLLQVGSKALLARAMREHPFSGLTIDVPRLTGGAAELATLIRAARKCTRNLMVLGLPGRSNDEALRAGGVSHVSCQDEGSAPPTPGLTAG